MRYWRVYRRGTGIMRVSEHFLAFLTGAVFALVIILAWDAYTQPCETDTECEARHGTE